MARTPDPADAHRRDLTPGDDRQPPASGASSASAGASSASAGASSASADRPTTGRQPAPRPRVGTDPDLDEHQKRGISGAMWIALLLGLLILVLLLVFILQNNVPAEFNYLGWAFILPLGVAMLLAAVAGALIMGLVGSVRLFKLGHRVRRLEKERAEIKRALD